MKITKVSEKKQIDPPWLNDTFQLELTGHQIVALYDCLYRGEGGSKHPEGGERMIDVLEGAFGEFVLESAMERLEGGIVRSK
jgi:hypothetical protein